MLIWDLNYYLFLIPGLLLAGLASIAFKSAMSQASRIRPSSGMCGAEAAARILSARGLDHVGIEEAQGFLGDHYDPRSKVLRLTPETYQGRTLAAVGIAAHEAGHAIQDAQAYAPLTIRNGIVPLASVGSNLAWVFLFAGMFLRSTNLIAIGAIVFSVAVLFQLINLPVEFDASARAREVLVADGIIMRNELAPISKVLNAAAMTYVAATITAILQLLYFLYRSGLLGGSRN